MKAIKRLIISENNLKRWFNSQDGTFISSPNNKLTYGTMVYVRVVIVNNMANTLALAATVAVRYAAVRRQSQLKPK